jgi:hypothetical protein
MKAVQTARKLKVPFMGVRVAVFDLGLTLGAGYWLTRKLNVHPAWSLLTLPLGHIVIVHKAVGVRTPLTEKVDALLLNKELT